MAKGRGILVFASVLLLYVITLNSVWATDHTASLLHLDYAIWTSHSFALGKVGEYASHSVDDFAYHGQYYTALAPGASLFSLPFVIPGFILDGGFSSFGSANLLSEFFVAFMNAIAVYFVYKLGRLYFGESTSVFLAFAYGLSTISWPFATFFFQNDVSSCFALMSVYAIIWGVRYDCRTTVFLLAGLAIGASALVDYVSAIIAPILLVYVALGLRGKGCGKRVISTTAFALGASAGILAIALYNLSCFGSPFVTSEQLYLHSSSIFADFSTPIYLGVVLNLVSPFRGILLFSPFLILGFVTLAVSGRLA
jgi:hypothetical protein